jgi:hypothetical protein
MRCSRPGRLQAPAVGQVEGRDLPRLVARQQLGCRSPAGLLLKIDVGKRLAVAELLQKPQCNEAQYRDEVKRNCSWAESDCSEF